jgi:hypothetical protein
MCTIIRYTDWYEQGRKVLVVCCEMVISMYTAVETHRRIFVRYQNTVSEIQQTVLNMEKVSWEIFGEACKYGHNSMIIFGDGCVGSNCMDMAVAKPIT